MKITTPSLLLILFGLLLQFNVHAQTPDLDIINLQNRSAEEIVPLLQPFLAPEAAVTARGYKLIIKSTPENLEEIRKLITELDTQIRQLIITVSVGRYDEQQDNSTEAQVKAEVKTDDTVIKADSGDTPAIEDTTSMGSIVRADQKSDKTKISAKVKVKKTTTLRERPVHQKIRSSEGQWATIRAGQAVPVVQRTRNADGTVTQTIKYHSATSGFSVLPRLQSNDRVLLYIRPSQTTPSREGGGKFDIQSLETNIQGKLGEWIALGSINELSRSSSRSNISSTRSRNKRQDNIFVKIEIAQ